MCYPTPHAASLQQTISAECPAKALTQEQRQSISVQALAGQRTVSSLANEFDVSRKFVYQQAATAQTALDDAFASATAEDQVLFHLPVTKSWLRRATLGLTLICHSSYRGVHEFFRDLLDVNVSVGTVHNTLQEAVAKARVINTRQKLNQVAIAGLDEIFQNGQPVLVGADISSTYCFLLSGEEQCDADTWAIRLLDLQPQGFAPQATVADFGTALRAGQHIAMPSTTCRGDVFHAVQQMVPVVGYLENQAHQAIAEHDKLRQQRAKLENGRRDQTGRRISLTQKILHAAQAEAQAIALADDIALLTRWLRHDVLAVSGLSAADRRALFDFIVHEFEARIDRCRHRLHPVWTLLKNHRDQLLAFAVQLDQDVTDLAADFEVPVDIVRQLVDLLTEDVRQLGRWQKEVDLRRQLRHRFYALSEAVRALVQRVVRASSVVENINSRLRNYFFLRRHLGRDYLDLLQFFLNHRRFLRSEHPQRVGKSPAELLTGQSHAHWLTMLGYSSYSRN